MSYAIEGVSGSVAQRVGVGVGVGVTRRVAAVLRSSLATSNLYNWWDLPCFLFFFFFDAARHICLEMWANICCTFSCSSDLCSTSPFFPKTGSMFISKHNSWWLDKAQSQKKKQKFHSVVYLFIMWIFFKCCFRSCLSILFSFIFFMQWRQFCLHIKRFLYAILRTDFFFRFLFLFKHKQDACKEMINYFRGFFFFLGQQCEKSQDLQR